MAYSDARTLISRRSMYEIKIYTRIIREREKKTGKK